MSNLCPIMVFELFAFCPVRIVSQDGGMATNESSLWGVHGVTMILLFHRHLNPPTGSRMIVRRKGSQSTIRLHWAASCAQWHVWQHKTLTQALDGEKLSRLIMDDSDDLPNISGPKCQAGHLTSDLKAQTAVTQICPRGISLGRMCSVL